MSKPDFIDYEYEDDEPALVRIVQHEHGLRKSRRYEPYIVLPDSFKAGDRVIVTRAPLCKRKVKP